MTAAESAALITRLTKDLAATRHELKAARTDSDNYRLLAQMAIHHAHTLQVQLTKAQRSVQNDRAELYRGPGVGR